MSSRSDFRTAFYAHDWASTPLGPVESWSAALSGPISYLLKTPQPVFLVAGPEMILLFNESLQKLMGERWVEALGKSVRDLWAPIWPQIGPLIERAHAGESFLVQDMGFRTWTSDFTEERYFTLAFTSLRDDQHRVVAACCSCSDTTDSVLRTHRAIEQRDRMLAMLNASSSFALATHGENHEIIYANSAFERVTSRTIVPGTPAGDMFSEAARQGVIAILDQVYRTGGRVRQDRHPYEVELPDGRTVIQTVNTVFEPIFDGGENPVGVFILGENQSDEVAAERKIENLQAELIHASRINAVGALGSAIAHELNQPLAAIANYAATAELLLSRHADEAELLDSIAEIAKSAVRAGDVIRSLREMVRKGSPKRELCRLEPLVQDAVRLPQGGNFRRELVSIDVPQDLEVWGDPTQIEQVLLNLFRNACESGAAAPLELSIRARPANDLVEITIHDSGPGIPEGKLPTIFKPFSSCKEEGLGLGLSICRTIVEAHGGHIRAENPPGGGAAFVFTLPGKSAG